MKNISIIFSKRSNFNLFSAAIMWGLKTPFSHVAVKMVDGDTGQIVYYQASGLNVNCMGEVEFLKAETIVDQVDITVSDGIFVAGKAFAIDQLGKPYYMLAIVGFAIQILAGMFGINVSNPFREDGSQFVCSQFAAAYINATDNIDLDVTDMTPKSLHETISNLPKEWK
jgi:hypothetical protein